MIEVHINDIRQWLIAIVFAEIACQAVHQFLGDGNHHSGMLIRLTQQGNLPGGAGYRRIAQLLLQQQFRQVLRDDIGNAIFLAYQHGGIACPLAAMSMQDIGFAVSVNIVVEHALDYSHPTIDVMAHQLGQSTLIRLTDGNTFHLMFVTAIGQRQIVFQPFRKPQLHITQNAHLMTESSQRLGLV